MPRLSALLLVLFSVVAQAAEEPATEELITEEPTQRIYRTVDEQGRPVFTDVPDHRAPAQELQIREQNTVPMVVPRIAPAEEDEVEVVLEYKLAITSPANEETLNNPESMTVAVSVNPAPAPGHALRILDNGQEVARVVEWPERGEHRLVAQVVDEDGKVLAESAPVVVYVQRVSLLNRK